MAPDVRVLDEPPPGTRALLDRAFEGDFDDHDWDHGLGGRHVVVLDAGEVVAHAAVVGRTIWIDDRPLRAGYVEGVGVEPARQGAGLGTAVMAAVTAIVRRDFELGVLGTGEWHFYERLGWVRWQGESWVRRADGRPERTPEDDDGIMVLAGMPVDLGADIACEERPGDVW